MGTVAYSSRAGRLVLLATVLGSGVAFLDGSVVNVALPHIARSLHSGFTTMQWVLDAYLLTLGAFVLVGGAVGDVLGRRAVYVTGLVGFGIASAGCAAAPSGAVLVGARAVQGLAAALLVPGSLALISATYRREDRDRAIGAWSGLAGLASALGPFLGGWLVDAASWRWVFLINVPIIAVAVTVTITAVPESRDDHMAGVRATSLDVPGAVLVAASLALLVVPLIETGLGLGLRLALVAAAAVVAAAFVRGERTSAAPMIPFDAVRSRVFAVANGITFVVYGALGGGLFLLAVQLQTGLGYSPLAAGASMVPMTVLLLLFSARVGALLPRLGARPLLTIGPVVAGLGLVLLARAVPGASYVGGVLPGVLVFAIGMCFVVAPITATAMGALAVEHAGLASGVNNAVARVAALLAVAVLPAVAGVHGGTRLPQHGYQLAMVATGLLTITGGVMALLGLPRRHVAVGAPDNVAA